MFCPQSVSFDTSLIEVSSVLCVWVDGTHGIEISQGLYFGPLLYISYACFAISLSSGLQMVVL